MSASALLTAHEVILARQNHRLVDGVSLAFPACGAVALIGPNGAGKSSLLSVLAGQVVPDKGVVSWQGENLARLEVAERAQCIGYLPQRFDPYWDVTLADLVDMRLQGRARVTRILERAGLQEFSARRWSTLSGGERARCMLAAVLAADPPALLADEPGAALDVQHRLALVQSLVMRGRDRLVVVVMHDLDLAFECFDRVVVMHKGRVALDGRPQELLHHPMLDQVFGVLFERIAIPPQTLLRARRQIVNDKEDVDAH